MPDLSSVKAKVERAREHLEAAKDVSHAFLHSHFYRVAARPHHNREKWRILVKHVDPFPPRFAILVGDAAHNLRSSLDHLAFAFAKPIPGKEKDVFFPIKTSRSEFRSTASRCLPGVSGKTLAAFDRLQPYKSRKRLELRLIAMLNTIDNWDKHRALLFSGIGLSSSRLDLFTTPKTPLLGYKLLANRIVEPGTVIGRFQLAPSGGKVKVNVNAHLELRPVFDKRMPKELRNVPVRVLMQLCVFLKSEVIPAFEKLP